MDQLGIKRDLTVEWGKPKLEITFKNVMWCENSTCCCVGWPALLWLFVKIWMIPGKVRNSFSVE